MTQTIMLTGGLGYIGSHTAVELIEAGYRVVVVDNLCNSRIEVLDGIERITGVRPVFERVDLSDKSAVHQLCERHTFGGCIHFAAYKAVGESVQKPLAYYENNLATLIYLLDQFVRFSGDVRTSGQYPVETDSDTGDAVV